jgi:membrane-associated phospholipid phosphatase
MKIPKTSNPIADIMIVMGGLLFVASLLGTLVFGNDSQLNSAITSWVATLQSDSLTLFFSAISSLLSPLNISLIATIFAMLIILRTDKTTEAVILVGSVAVAQLVTMLVKIFISNPRPQAVIDSLGASADWSFPSGHTVSIIVLVGVLLTFVRYYADRRQMAIMSTLGVLVIGIVAFSRIYLGYHWALDVVGGIGLGLVVVGLAFAKIKSYNSSARY